MKSLKVGVDWRAKMKHRYNWKDNGLIAEHGG